MNKHPEAEIVSVTVKVERQVCSSCMAQLRGNPDIMVRQIVSCDCSEWEYFPGNVIKPVFLWRKK